MNSIQEMLVAPMSPVEMVFGYILGSLARAMLIAELIMALGFFLVHTLPENWLLYFGVMIFGFGAVLGAGNYFRTDGREIRSPCGTHDVCDHAAGFCRRRLHVGEAAAAALRHAELVNPMFYTIDAFRHSYTAQSYLPLWLSVSAIAVLMLLALGIALRMAVVGYKLRT